MIMKNIISNPKTLLLLVPILTLLFSCTEKLDLKPKQSIDAAVALTTPANIKATLVGAYLDGRSSSIFGTAFNEYSELYASTGDMLFLGTFEQPREFIEKKASVTNSYVENTWVQAYKLINTCNMLLNPETLAILEDEDRDLVEGEARFLRGWTIFEMTRLFGLPYEAGETNDQLAVPLILTPTKDVADAVKVPRDNVEDCYTQALNDLTAARNLLPEDNGIYASSLAARAILARIFLQMGNYSGAAAEANYIIETGAFALTETPLKAFNNNSNSPEDIFAFQNNVASNNPWLAVMYASLNGAGRGDYEIQQVFLDRFDPSDQRGMYQSNTETFYTIANINKMYYKGVGTIVNSGGINTSKWGNYYTILPMIRLAEMYLIRAEANFEDPGADIGPNTPTQDINVVRARSNAPQHGSAVTREQIREERYLELCWEGFRLHDLKRWKEDIDGYAYDAGNLILPVPFREMEVNELLVQNDWYLTGK